MPMPRMKVRFTPNWSPTERFGTASARSRISRMPPGPRASAVIAVMAAGVLSMSCATLVAVTTISSRASEPLSSAALASGAAPKSAITTAVRSTSELPEAVFI